MRKLCQQLKYLRKKNDLTQADLAQDLGFSRTTIANYEQNKRNPSPKTLCKLADYFEVTVDFLLGRDDKQKIYDDSYLILLKINSENGNILDCSQGALIFYGYKKQEILKRNIMDLSQTSKKKLFYRLSKNNIFFDKHINSSNITIPVEIINKKPLSNNNSNFLIIIPQNKYKDLNNDLIDILSSIIYYIDPYNKYHGRNVALIASEIGKQLALDKEILNLLQISGKIHDLGKISIPYKILNKPEKLDNTESLIIQKHPKVGYKLLKNVNFNKPVARIVLQHHERMDGSGYPQGLKGEEILFEARIIAVADVLDAMTTSKPYRSRLSNKKAFKIISQNSGIKFDKKVVNACKKISLSQLIKTK